MYNRLVPPGSAWNRRDLWLPVLVACVGVLASLAGWGVLISGRRAEILDATERAAAQTRDAVEKHLQTQVGALEGLTQLWGDFGLGDPPEWRADVDQQVEQTPGLTSVAWVDLDDRGVRTTAGKARSDEEIDFDLEDARRFYPERHLSGPRRDASGAFLYRVVLPASTPEDQAGMLVARFHVAPLLENVLQARAEGYALSVLWDGEEIFSQGVPSADPWQRWWRVEETITLPLEGQWRIVHRPTAAFAAARLPPIPHYLLAAGILLSLVLAVLAHQLRLTVRQSRFLVASNRALERRGIELESRVAERTAALQEAVVELEAFNYSVSHDLRSPLSAILNFTSILAEDYADRPLDAEGRAILARIARSASRATALLEGLLGLSRAGRASLTLRRIDMTSLAREAFAQVRAGADEEDGEVELRIDPLPVAVGDRNLLGDVFANLFSNALKYSRGCEKRRIAVSGREDERECVYEVSDNGKGFDMRFAEKLFGVFERLHAEEGVEGTGVGLAMVARIVKRHGGRVFAEGRVGEGARFGFALPRREAP